MTISYSYDTEHNLEYLYDSCEQVRLRNYYDVNDKVYRQDIGDANYLFSYDDANSIATITNLEGVAVKMNYGDSGELLSETVYTKNPNEEPNSFTTTYLYDSNKQRIRELQPNENCIVRTYDGLGNILGIYRKTAITDPCNPNDPNVLATTYTYDPNFAYNVKTERDPNGVRVPSGVAALQRKQKKQGGSI